MIRTMVPRLMLIYSPPFERLYNKRNAQEPICLLSCVVEIVQISEQDNIETLLRFTNSIHREDRVFGWK